MKIKKIINGVLALLIAGGILLFSDLSNRVSNSDKESKNTECSGLHAAAGRNYTIGLTYFAPDQSLDMTLDGLWKGLAELGFVKDSNLTVIDQHANGEIANLQPIHLNMDNQKVDLILVTSTPGIAAAVPTVKKHPMVFTMSYTPLEAGAGKSFTDHLPSITGVGSFPPVEKTMDFIRESFPGAKRIGTVYNSSEANSRKVIEIARDYTSKLGIELVENTVINTSEVFQAVSTLCSRNIDALWVTGDNTALQAFHAIVKVCKDHKMPLIINDVDYINEGALAAIGVGWYKTGYHTASFVARVLNGESPAEIPIENYVDELIAINKDRAAELGVKFPDKYLNPDKNSLKGKNYQFCMAEYTDSPNSEEAERGVREELKRLGLEEGTDFTLKVFNAQGDISTLNSISEAIASEKWDIIFSSSTPTTQSLSRKVKDMPLVFTNVGDPVRAGLGKSFEDHLPNITGMSTVSDFDGLVKLVVESMPGIKKIGTVFTPGEINSVVYKEELEKAAKKRGLTLVAVPANTVTEVADAASSIATQGIQAFTQILDNLTSSCGPTIIKVAYDTKIPVFAFVDKQVKQGAVAAVSRDYYTAGVEAVGMAKEILEGKSPKDIPFQYVSKTNVAVNSDAMKYFRVKIPEKYIEQKLNPLKGKNYKFCLAHYIDSPNSEDCEQGIRDQLKNFGLQENVDFTLKVYNAQGDISTLNSIVDAISNDKWDLIMITSTPTIQAVSKKITKMPVVFTNVGDPVRARLGESFEKHLPNLTGISTMSDFDGLVKLVVETMPGIKTIGTIYTTGEINSVAYKEELEKAAKKQGLTLIAVPANSATEVSDAAQSICSRGIQAFTQISDNLTASCGATIIKAAYDSRIPYFAFIDKQVPMGAIAAVSRDYYFAGVDAANMAKQVLEGKSPQEIPFRFVTKSSVFVNHDAINYFKVKIPEKYLSMSKEKK